jgi:hypothetical protein
MQPFLHRLPTHSLMQEQRGPRTAPAGLLLTVVASLTIRTPLGSVVTFVGGGSRGTAYPFF